MTVDLFLMNLTRLFFTSFSRKKKKDQLLTGIVCFVVGANRGSWT